MAKLTKSSKLNSLLFNMGIYTPYDVINHLPNRYEDFSLTDLNDLKDKQKIVIEGRVITSPKVNKSKRVEVVTFDFMSKENKYFRVVAFNRGYLCKTLNFNELYTLIGVFNFKRNEIDLINIVKGKIEEGKKLKPVYSLPQSYPNHLFSSLVKRSLEELKGKIYTSVPYSYINKYKLIKKEDALNLVHSPKTYKDVRDAYRYLKYEEALTFAMKNLLIKEENKSLAKIKKEPIGIESCEAFLKSLPYQLTEDQIRASSEIIEDMNQSSLMYRLLQGDVGTGKTLVSFIALYANYVRGDQGALMAPTDSLARQHYKNAVELFRGTKIKIALLLGSTKASEKKQIYDDLRDGYIDIVIGTHALFSKSVNYSSLGLVVIDEQHRFGVNQRLALASKGDHADLLMMSATPIPRSLALTLYGDLDISSLAMFPNKTRKVKTLILESESERIFKAIDNSLSQNKQVYIVAPIIDFKDDGRYSAEQLYARFALKYGKKVGYLHGKMKNEEKEDVLNKFYSNETPILVSTQVIEVGIDVKNANLMIVYDASFFGLASLHQLRGRVGRDGENSYCILTYNEGDEESKEKLNIMCKTEDGFVIAEEDLKLRGPGELTGFKQSGLPNFTFLNPIDDLKIFIVARDDALEILKNKDKAGNSYFVEYIKKQISTNDTIKG